MEKEYNILKHELAPEYTVLKDDERKQLLDKLKIRSEQLPKVLTNDPVVKAIQAKEGNVIKIVRKSQTAGESIYYRVVVSK